jgi:hypothetical protein
MRIALLGAVTAALAAGAISSAAGSPQTMSSFYLARQDPRLCPSPTCGGLWVRLVNRSRTTCGDGSRRRECYVAAVHLSALRLGTRRALQLAQLVSSGRALVRGALVPEGIGSFTLDGLVVSEAWTASSSKRPASGTFHELAENGVRCTASPCFSIRAAALNSRRNAAVSSVDLTRTGAPPAEQRSALARIPRDGLVAAGRIVRVPHAGPAGPGRTLVASQFYVRAAR